MSTSAPLIIIIVFSLSYGTFVCIKEFDISNVIASLICFAFNPLVIRIAYVTTMGRIASSLGKYFLCTLLFAHILAFNVPSIFSVRNIRLSIAFDLSVRFSSFKGTCISTTLSYICFTSL